MQDPFELAPAFRYRCFGPDRERRSPCPLPGKWRAPDVRRVDALTFYCDEHRPNDAAPIGEDQPFLELCASGLIIIGAATLRASDAKIEAVCAVQAALARMGARFVPADVRAALKTGRLILPARDS